MPAIGQIVDNVGYRMYFILGMCLLVIFAHTQFLMIEDDTCDRCWMSIIPLVIYGVCLAIHQCVFWPSVVFFAPEEIHGTAFGIMACFENVGMSLFPPMMSLIHEHTKASHGYFWVEVVFLILSLILLGLSYWVFCLDFKLRGGLLQDLNPNHQFKKYMKAKLRKEKL